MNLRRNGHSMQLYTRYHYKNKSALENPEYRDKDGLCQGEFIVHVEVSEYGQRSRNDIVIKVGKNWEHLDAEISKCGCYKKSWFKSRTKC